ncbi:MAG: protein BatD [Planctomycetes bacterium]|nr:protein BatD [Planctomycetota bacterium]
MTSKTQKHKSIVVIVYALITGALLLVCVGCEKSNDARTKKAEFEIDKDYQRGPLTVHIRADKTKMTIAETVLLELEAAIETGFEVKMPKVDKVLENFGIVDWDNLGDKLDQNNNVVQTYQYRLEPFLSGTFAIPAFTFEFYDINSPEENKYELTTEPIDIEVTSLLGEQRAELVIADIEDVVQMSREKSYFWFWSLGIVGITAAGMVVWMYLRKKKKAELIRIFKPAHEIAYEKLRALVKEDLIKAGKIKEFYEQISNILRHYIEHRFNLRAPERTTEEFLIELAGAEVLGANDKEDLGEFLIHCDLVKFARHNPATEQIQKTFDLVKNFIEKTKSDEKKIDVTEAEVGQTVEAGSV